MPPSNTVQSYIERAFSLYSSGHVKEARQLAMKIAGQGIAFPNMYNLLAGCERRLGNYNDSESYYKNALKYEAKNPQTYNGYGLLLSSMGEEERAEELFNQVLKLDSANIDGLLNLASLYKRKHRLNCALLTLEKAIKAHPGKPSVVIPYVDILATLKHESALMQQLSSVERHKDRFSEQQLVSLGKVLRRCGKYSEALSWLTYGLTRYTGSIALRQLAAMCCQLSGQKERAEDLLKDCLKIDETDFKTHEILSELLWLRNEKDSFAYYRAALEKYPENQPVLAGMLLKLIKVEHFDEANEYISRLLKLNASNPYAHAAKGYISRETGSFEQAISSYRKASNLAPGNSNFLRELAVCHMVNQEYPAADEYIQKLIKSNPYDQGWWACKATLLRLMGRMDEYYGLYNYSDFVQVYSCLENIKGQSSDCFLDELKCRLEEFHRDKNHPIDQSLRHGTQTMDNLFDMMDPTIQRLRTAIDASLERYIQQLPVDDSHPFLRRVSSGFKYQGSWSVKLKSSGFHKNHYHHEGWISAPLYVDIPSMNGTDGQGWLKLGQPELSRFIELEPDYVVKPKEGCVVFFPSYMWHGTIPFTSQSNRLSVAFDVVPK
ncbi:hypothetical protein HMF8227_00856 [Saliniradius amylolyticus]|uniref:Uncharacterized protein n=1 Tax=Saliniradius amylolyticus TaxID=2183582 RepID=A0A2S2E130_9ALTE|nr:tetratricopeptide repeat protein [Saliniradius amylolyticus]AWL11351.1 hypothetical protein HMF8227_00856 [Saliniradius amylolyticus]